MHIMQDSTVWTPYYKDQINQASILKSYGVTHCPFSLPKDQCQLTEARVLYEAVLEVQVALLGPNHPQTLDTKGNLAVVMKDQGELREALPRRAPGGEERAEGASTAFDVDPPPQREGKASYARRFVNYNICQLS